MLTSSWCKACKGVRRRRLVSSVDDFLDNVNRVNTRTTNKITSELSFAILAGFRHVMKQENKGRNEKNQRERKLRGLNAWDDQRQKRIQSGWTRLVVDGLNQHHAGEAFSA